MGDQEFRVEHDTMGEVKVPATALWRAQTQRAVENFPISGRPLERSQIRALGLLKAAAARVNAKLGVLPPDVADAIAEAADDVATGKYDDHFPLDVFQTGSGTSSNMNANEVIATLATRALGVEVHPNDHVNASQSSNDVFPTTIHLAATEAVAKDVIPALGYLARALRARAEDWREVVKAGRTHLMDAVPVTLGQEFAGYAAQIALGCERVQSALVHVGLLAVLFLGVRFQSHPPAVVTVELWETPPPQPVVEQPKPPPVVKPEPEPEPVVKKPPEIALPEKPKPKPKPKPQPPKRDLAFEKRLREQAATEQKQLDEQRRERELRELIARQQAAARNKAIAAWQDKIVGKVRGNIIFDITTVPPNIEAIFDVTLLPSGEVLDAIKRKSSGNAAYDDAVYRAILKSSPLPKPDDPSVFERRLTLKFHPGDR